MGFWWENNNDRGVSSYGQLVGDRGWDGEEKKNACCRCECHLRDAIFAFLGSLLTALCLIIYIEIDHTFFKTSSKPKPPSTPDLKLAYQGPDYLDLTWETDPYDCSTTYGLSILDRTNDSGSYIPIDLADEGRMGTARVGQLFAFSAYSFKLQARNQYGNSSWGSAQEFRTGTAVSPPIPTSPIILDAATLAGTTLLPKANATFQFTVVADGGARITKATLEYATSNSSRYSNLCQWDGTPTATLPFSATCDGDLPLTINDIFLIRFKVQNSNGESDFSEDTRCTFSKSQMDLSFCAPF